MHDTMGGSKMLMHEETVRRCYVRQSGEDIGRGDRDNLTDRVITPFIAKIGLSQY